MSNPTLCVVTASTNVDRARACLTSWGQLASERIPIFLVLNGALPPNRIDIPNATVAWSSTTEYLGSVAAFRRGVEAALAGPFDLIACLHDDFEILESDWDLKVTRAFSRQPNMGLAGFGGAIGLGAEDLYQKPYDPMSLARSGFRSNLVDAEVHGYRSLLSEPVACLDGFSQIGRREFWKGLWSPARIGAAHTVGEAAKPAEPVWEYLERLGIIHHLYDSLLGAIAARHGWETWYIPLRSQHHGGRTAVGDEGYQRWAKSRMDLGDQDFWKSAHKIGYEEFRDVLPLRV